MSLFGLLHDDAFLIFSREQRYFYARVVVDLFRRFFSDTVTFPTRTEVVAAIYDCLRANPDLWREGDSDDRDDGTSVLSAPDIRSNGRQLRRSNQAGEGSAVQDEMRSRAWRAYNRLLRTGWLDEEVYGLRVTVDMPPAAMLLADRLAALEKGLSASFRGVVSLIRGSLSSALTDLMSDSADTRAPGAAAGIHKAAEMALGFSRELRMVLASLRTIEREILGSDSLKTRLEMFFRDFIGQLVLKDFESIYKTNHPYRYKDEILGYLERLEDEGLLRRLLLDGYIGSELAPTTDEARALVDADLFTLRTVFDSLDQTYERINSFRVRLETRLRNTIKYADLGDQRHGQRIGALIARLDSGLASATALGIEPPAPDGLMVGETAPWAEHLLREPVTAHPAVRDDTLQPRRISPALLAWRARLRQYNDLFIVHPQHVLAFLDRHLASGEHGEARLLPLETVEDFLAFEHLRRYRHAPPAPVQARYRLAPCPIGLVRDDEWLRCENFLIHRLPQPETAR
mgnify:CR=1 FL=1